jgi:uncharacterized protein (TIGR03437 family)
MYVSAPIRARWTSLGLLLTCLGAVSWAQESRVPSRVPNRIDNTRRTTLGGHVHPQARSEFDQGRVRPDATLDYVTLELEPSAAQKADLEQLLAEQQNPGSPNYHHWLTPEQYADRFGVSAQDANTIAAWLQSQGLTVHAIGRGRSWIAFGGTAAQLETAFQTELHQYNVDGAIHIANATEPSVPAALGGIVKGIRGLNDFRPKPAPRTLRKPASREGAKPEYTTHLGDHNIAPNDFSTIYNVNPLYSAGIDGTGQTLVIAGQTRINLSDIRQFRSEYGLPAQDPQIVFVPGSRDPGLSSSDLPEADLDLEWSGAVARGATIVYVYAWDVMAAVQYAVDQDLAPVISVSYGFCEPEQPSSYAALLRSTALQANAEGITWFAASGDNGAADCGDTLYPGLAVDMPASIPEVTGVGGTEFQEGTGHYWRSTNDATSASALSYIPETAWNDSALDGTPAATGGGASIYFAKPFWQTGPGVPADNARHVPDVALASSADHDGYLVVTSGGDFVYGGTSVAAPSFAGIAALINHSLIRSGAQSSAGLGNMNPKLYSLAQTDAGAFHDTTTGNNMVTVACPRRSPNCTVGAVGFSAGSGYDQATGLGSVDVAALVSGWNNGSSIPQASTSSISLLTNLNTVAGNQVVVLIATVESTTGATPGGTVTFNANGVSLGSVALTGSAGKATAMLAVQGSQLPQGSAKITALYDAGGSSGSLSASLTVSVQLAGSGSHASPAITSLSNAASSATAFAPGEIVTVVGSQLAPSTESAGTIPLPYLIGGVTATVNGVAAPLYFVSPAEMIVQIPYETTPGSALLTINNGGQVVSKTLTISPAAPGIFVDQNRAPIPNATAAPGDVVSLYITGTGTVTPAVATGDAPASSIAVTDLPKPTQVTSVTVGGQAAVIKFIGIPWNLVGVLLINYQVPSGFSPGVQPVIVTTGGVSSPAANLTITK